MLDLHPPDRGAQRDQVRADAGVVAGLVLVRDVISVAGSVEGRCVLGRGGAEDVELVDASTG